MISEQRPLIVDTRVYRRRWWVLAVFCLAGMVQASIWNTWGPIAESAEIVFGWSDGQLALIPSLADLTFLLFVIPVTIFMDIKGLRVSMILCSALLVLCSGMRCFTLKPGVFTPLAQVSSAIQGVAGIAPFAGPPLLSAVWFPVEQRPMATACGSFFSYFGLSLSFIVGPQLVPGPIHESTPVNISSNHTTEIGRQLERVSNIHELETGISNYMYIIFGLALLVFVLVLIYFPAKPPRPPSITASIQRTDYKHAVQKLFKNGPLWIISIAGAIQIGVSGAWISVIDVIVKEIGVSQIDAGWMGFLNTVIGCSSGIIIAQYSSRLHRRRKIFLVVAVTGAAVCVTWFALLCDSVLAFSLPSMYVSFILLGILVNGPIPLFYEMAAEVSYPVGEGVTGGFFTSMSSVFGIAFFGVISVPNVGTTWLNWMVVGSIVVSVMLLLAFPERYNRSDIDMKTKQPPNNGRSK